MKPAFDKLAAEYSDSKTTVIGDVDCTKHQGLCSQHGVRGYPTIKYWAGGDAEDYKGGRTFDALKKFVEENLGPVCSLDNKDACEADQLKELEAAAAMPAADRKAEITKLDGEIKAAQKAHEDLLESLQKQFEESKKKSEETVASIQPRLRVLKSIKDDGKSEL
jgi:hypothetical protein